jgi:hypothetical protein
MNSPSKQDSENPTSKEDCELLYHYTDEAGLSGIIEHDNIWATHVRFLNDWTELREAFREKYVEFLIDSFCEGLPAGLDEDVRRIIDRISAKRNVGKILKIIESPNSPNETFVFCLTGSAEAWQKSAPDPGDRLSQWRAYSHSSQGFSLGFDKKLLGERIELNNRYAKASLLRCIYEEDERTAFFREIGRDASSLFEAQRQSDEPTPAWFHTNKPDASEEYKKLNSYFLSALSKATAEFFAKAAQIKHSGFREEFEWRIIFQAHKDALYRNPKNPSFVKFRNGHFGRIPYIEIPLSLKEIDKSPLRRIIVGPGARSEDVKHSVELLLLGNGIQVRPPDDAKGVEVSTSQIPYRQ